MVGGLMLAVALICGLAAMLVARRKSAKKAAKQALTLDEEENEWTGNGSRPARRRAYASPDQRAASEVTESIVSLANAAGRAQRRRGNGHANGRETTTDAMSLLQSGDRRTMVAVLGAVAAVGWLMGRTLPSSDTHPQE
jgi:hypothetical protein